MRFPKLRPQGAKTLKVPDLAGGINLRDGISEVLDTQLTQATNVWYQDGLLKTRPGVHIDENLINNNGAYQSESTKVKNFPNIKVNIDEGEYILQVRENLIEDNLELEFVWASANDTIYLGYVGLNDGSYFVAEHGGVIYIFSEYGDIYKCNYIQGDGFEFVDDRDVYTPLVLTDCKANDSISCTPDVVKMSGVMFEGYNLIGHAYKVQYTAFNPDIAYEETDEGEGDVVKTHKMRYFLPESAENLKGETIKVKHTTLQGVTEHEVTFSTVLGEVTYEDKSVISTNNDSMRIVCVNNCIWFNQNAENINEVMNVYNEEHLRNNIEITIPYTPNEEEEFKVYGMTNCEWFGGAAEGIAGGTRLFLCGNTNEENKNLVVWSDLNNPLYFPENNYFRVGESSSAVKGFGKQSDMLVIFKENGCGVYYTKYQQNTEISGEDLINQSVIDYTASSVYFPLVQINANIGCSHPETIQLCRNRLVWLGNNNNVYTLVNESQYNERSIFSVSEMIARDLRKSTSAPTACDWNGYYCLMCGNKMYLMDYNCYGYTHIASYSKNEDANIRIPWYIWEFPISGNVATVDETVLISCYTNEGGDVWNCCFLNYVINPNANSIDSYIKYDENIDYLPIITTPIHTMLRTKLFTFGEPNNRKCVDRINLMLGNNGGEPITVKVITEHSQEEHDICLMGDETEAYTPAYIDSKAIFPTARNFLRVGVELSSEGVIAVDGMEFKFRTLGGAR